MPALHAAKRPYRLLSAVLQNWWLSRHLNRSTKSLPHLPNKVLTIISHHLDPSDIKTLLLVNRRLSFALTPIYQSLRLDTLRILTWGSSSGSSSGSGFSGLHWAAANGHEKLTRLLLLDRGFSPDVRVRDHGTTPLHYAAMNGHAAVVRVLLERGADVDARDCVFKETARDGGVVGELVNLHGMTPLHYAAAAGRKDIVPLLLNAGARIDGRDLASQRTPLIIAALYNHKGVVKVLLERGADVAAVDRYGWRAKNYTEASGISLVANCGSSSSNRTTPLLQAAEKVRDRKLKRRRTDMGLDAVKARRPREQEEEEEEEEEQEGGAEAVRVYCSDSYQQGVGEFLNLGKGPTVGRPQVGPN